MANRIISVHAVIYGIGIYAIMLPSRGFSVVHLVIMPVDNNEHQRIDDVSTDRISYGIQSLETMCFAL